MKNREPRTENREVKPTVAVTPHAALRTPHSYSILRSPFSVLRSSFLLFAVGCATPNEKCALDRCPDFPPGAMPVANGTFVRRIQDAQSIKAEADDFVIYKHEWYLGGAQLGPYGQYHLQQIAQRLPSVPFTVVIQTTMDPKLNDQRWKEIVNALLAAGLTDAEQRVVVGYPEAEGLYGEEGALIYQQIQQGGGSPFGPNGGAYGNGLGYGTGRGGFGNGNFFGGDRSLFRGNLGLGSFPFF